MNENKDYTPQELLKLGEEKNHLELAKDTTGENNVTRQRSGMEELKICDVFTEEDIKFNRRMVDEGMESKTKINNTSLFKNHNYNYVSEIVNEFRRKWGIHE